MTRAVDSKMVKAARVASGMTQEQAAEIIDVSTPTYIARERVPGAFTIDELANLYDEFSDDGKRIVASFVSDIFLRRGVTLNV